MCEAASPSYQFLTTSLTTMLIATVLLTLPLLAAAAPTHPDLTLHDLAAVNEQLTFASYEPEWDLDEMRLVQFGDDEAPM